MSVLELDTDGRRIECQAFRPQPTPTRRFQRRWGVIADVQQHKDLKGLNARLAILYSPNMQRGRPTKLHLTPFEIGDLRGPQTVAEGDQDQGCVAMTVAAVLGNLDQLFDLGLGAPPPPGGLSELPPGPRPTMKQEHPAPGSQLILGVMNSASENFKLSFSV
jgi:hypothetical protein